MEALQPACLKCGKKMGIARLQCGGCGVTVEGEFDLTPLAKLSLSEQAFVTAFVRVHGNIKKMERLLGISYPTVKNRLNQIARNLDGGFQVPDEAADILERIEKGELSVQEALDLLP